MTDPMTTETPVKSFKVLRDSEIEFEATKGTTVYEQIGRDYGLASHDTRVTGVKHISVTLNSDGSYPGFTIPLADLEEIT